MEARSRPLPDNGPPDASENSSGLQKGEREKGKEREMFSWGPFGLTQPPHLSLKFPLILILAIISFISSNTMTVTKDAWGHEMEKNKVTPPNQLYP